MAVRSLDLKLLDISKMINDANVNASIRGTSSFTTYVPYTRNKIFYHIFPHIRPTRTFMFLSRLTIVGYLCARAVPIAVPHSMQYCIEIFQCKILARFNCKITESQRLRWNIADIWYCNKSKYSIYSTFCIS